MSEQLDIYDDNMQKIGTAPREEAHQKGLWHRTFHCWVTSGQERKQLLFQRRVLHKDTFPGKLDKSSAGHLLAGEQLQDGVRELQEELGLMNVTFEELVPCGVVRNVTTHTNGWVDKEFCHVFMLERELSLELLHPQLDELDGLYWVPAIDYVQLMSGELQQVSVQGYVWQDADGTEEIQVLPSKLQAVYEDFTPQPLHYLQLLKQMLNIS